MGKSPHGSRRTERIGQLLFVATQAAQTLATEQLQPLGLSAKGWGGLSTLSESGPLTQIELATALAIDRTAMVYLLDEAPWPAPADRTATVGISLVVAARRLAKLWALRDGVSALLAPVLGPPAANGDVAAWPEVWVRARSEGRRHRPGMRDDPRRPDRVRLRRQDEDRDRERQRDEG